MTGQLLLLTTLPAASSTRVIFGLLPLCVPHVKLVGAGQAGGGTPLVEVSIKASPPTDLAVSFGVQVVAAFLLAGAMAAVCAVAIARGSGTTELGMGSDEVRSTWLSAMSTSRVAASPQHLRRSLQCRKQSSKILAGSSSPRECASSTLRGRGGRAGLAAACFLRREGPDMMRGALQVMKGWEKGMFPPDAKFPAGYHFGDSPLNPPPYI